MSCEVTAKINENTATVIIGGKPVVVKVTENFVKSLSSDICNPISVVNKTKNFAIVTPIFGTVGPAGANGTNGRTILNGTVDPVPLDGVDGDFFINTTSFYIFGPKLSGVWPAGVFLGGSKILTGSGVPAPALQGDSYLYIDTSTGKVYYKVTGSWIDTGLYFHISTSTLPEGSNLYYTAARFNTAFSSKSTTDLTEGTNLYFTDARARTAAVENAINSGTTNKAPSEDAVFVALSNKQPLASTLTALAAFNTNGLITQTAADTFTGRTITGTTSNINVTNGNGVAGNPTIDLANAGLGAATYPNPRSITTDAKGRVTSVTPGDAPEFESILFDDFVSSLNSSSLGWGEVRSGANAFSTVVASGCESFNKAQGTLQLSTGTTAGGRTCSNLGATMGIGYATISQKWRMWVTSLSTVAEEFSFVMGFGDVFAGAGIAQTNGISFVYDRLTSANWICRTTKAGVTTQTITATAVNSTGFNNYQININSAGTSVDFIINGVTVATHTLNIPGFLNFTGPIVKISKSAGTTARTVLVDYFFMKISYAVAR